MRASLTSQPQMKLFAVVATILFSITSAQAAILIFDGPAPLKSYGTETSVRKNHSVLVYDTTAGQIGIINYSGKRRNGNGEQNFMGTLSVDGGTVPIRRGSITILSGVSRTTPEAGDFSTRLVSFRGRNSVLNQTTDLTGPRVIAGIARVTNRTSAVLTHWEQSFSLVYQSKLSDAANIANDSFDDALNRVAIDLQNRGYASLRK